MGPVGTTEIVVQCLSLLRRGFGHITKSQGATDTGYVSIPEGSEAKLMAAIGTQCPIAVAVDASLDYFQHYAEGVYYDPDCDESNRGHAVLAVGFGVSDKGEEYWIVKNSWGETWGDEGYILMRRNKDNHCGIASEGVFTLV